MMRVLMVRVLSPEEREAAGGEAEGVAEFVQHHVEHVVRRRWPHARGVRRRPRLPPHRRPISTNTQEEVTNEL